MRVGLRVYQAKLYKEHKQIKPLAGKHGLDISKYVRSFLTKYSGNPLIRQAPGDGSTEGEKRSLKFELLKDDGHSIHGVIRYGVFGYATEIEDVSTGAIMHTRLADEADTVPLYFRFWWPPGYSYGLWGFQSFSGKSCARSVLSEFRDEYRGLYDNFSFEATKVVPNEIKQYANASVKKITLVAKNKSSQTISAALRPKSIGASIDVDLQIKARGSSTFGKLKEMKGKLSGNTKIGTIDYGQAYATIQVDGKPKKIGVMGVSSNTGVIDITDDVDFDTVTNIPKTNSVASAVKEEFKDFVKRLGK